MNTIFAKTFNVKGKPKNIKIVNGDLADVKGSYDILVCSAFKDDYIPLPKTVIGRLSQMGISVANLATNPDINCKDFGGWLSKETGNEKFKRVYCAELLDYNSDRAYHAIDYALKSAFSTLKFVLEQAMIKGISTRKILLPILGAGSQSIELGYVVPPLIYHAKAILRSCDVDELIFFEINKTKAEQLKEYFFEALEHKKVTDVFISYSTKRSENAYEVANILKENGITYWMAPQSIPPSSNYITEMSNALTNTKVFLLMLSPEAEVSQWVGKEIESAVSANKPIIPCQLFPYDISDTYALIMRNCQMFVSSNYKDYKKELVKAIKMILEDNENF